MIYKKLSALLLAAVANLPVYAAEEESIVELEEVVVTGSSNSQVRSIVKPNTVLSGERLRTSVGQSLGATLANQPGITSQSFGAGVGTPVIRGQAGARVKVLQNSLGNNDVSALSPDHSTGVDPIIAERIEVFRGPSTLLYGSGAIGGIVNVIDNRIPEKMPDKLIGGAAEQRYDSASNESSSALKLEGGKSGFAYHLDGFYRDQNNTHTGGKPIDEAAVRSVDSSYNGINLQDNTGNFIANSQALTRGGSIGMSKIGDAGLVGVAINSLSKLYGIPPDGKTGDNVVIDMHQTKYDFKSQLNKPVAWAEQLRFKFGYTDYQHTELNNGIPATTFINQAYESRLELVHQPIGAVKGTLGFQSNNSRFSALGSETLVPKSDIDSYSLFDVESISVGAMSYDFGLRTEWQSVRPENRTALSYAPISGSASAQWQLDKRQQINLAFTHSERAPQIQELLSNGVHDATHSYEQGNIGLNKELSNNLDLSYHLKTDRLTTDISLFHNWVSDYIYQQRSRNVFDEVSQTPVNTCTSGTCIPILQSSQAAATFKGFEAQTLFSLMQNRYGAIDLTLFSDYTRGSFDNGQNVPRLPPLRYGFQLSYEKNNWSANARLTRGEAQTHPGQNETNTAGYLLLNLGTQYRLTSIGDSEILLFAKGKNLLNETIRNSTSYLRNFAPEPGRSAEVGIRISY